MLAFDERQCVIGRIRYSQRVRLLAFQALPGLDPQVQLQFAIDAADPFVIPAQSFDVAQIQEA
jgi:hypothetical protein